MRSSVHLAVIAENLHFSQTPISYCYSKRHQRDTSDTGDRGWRARKPVHHRRPRMSCCPIRDRGGSTKSVLAFDTVVWVSLLLGRIDMAKVYLLRCRNAGVDCDFRSRVQAWKRSSASVLSTVSGNADVSVAFAP